MRNEENIVRYTMDELRSMRARGESQTDWAYIDALTDEALEASIDWDDEGEFDPDSARAGIPGPQEHVSLWVDDDIVAWFRTAVEGTGLGYKTRMNEVLREYMEARREHPAPVETVAAQRPG